MDAESFVNDLAAWQVALVRQGTPFILQLRDDGWTELVCDRTTAYFDAAGAFKYWKATDGDGLMMVADGS